MPDNKAKYISVAVITEGEQSRAVSGSPPNPVTLPTELWVALSSCELAQWAPTATGNVPGPVNIQGTTTTLTGPEGGDNSFTYAVAIDPGGNSYALNFVYDSAPPTTNAKYFIAVFAPNVTGDIAPIRSIQGAATGFPAIVAQWASDPEAPWAGLCLDGTSRIYAGVSDTVLRFAAGADGDAAGTIFVQDTAAFGQGKDNEGISSVFFDAVRQWIWVSYQGPSVPGVDAYDLSGVRQRRINSSFFVQLGQIGIAPDGSIYVGDSPGTGLAVWIFPADANGTLDPTAQITIDALSSTVTGLALDANGKLYLCYEQSGTIPTVAHLVSFAAGTTGHNPTPLTDISGNLTGLDEMLDSTLTNPQQLLVR